MTQLTSHQAYELTGKRSEAELLRSFSFWQTKAVTKRDGKYWIIKTVNEIMDDGILYGPSTIYKGIRSLAAKGLIHCKHHPHPYKNLMKSSWIRLADDLEQRLLELEEVIENSSICSKSTDQTDQNNQSLYTGDLTGDLTGENKGAGKPALVSQSSETDKMARLSKDANTPVFNKVRIARRLRKKNSVLKSPDVFYEFLSQSREIFPEHTPDPYNPVQLKFAKAFLTNCRSYSLSDVEILHLIASTVKNWDDFRQWKKVKAGMGIKAEYANLKDMMRFTEQAIAFDKTEAVSEEEYVPKVPGTVNAEGIFIPDGWED